MKCPSLYGNIQKETDTESDTENTTIYFDFTRSLTINNKIILGLPSSHCKSQIQAGQWCSTYILCCALSLPPKVRKVARVSH